MLDETMYKYLVISGNTGVGKSTLLHAVTRNLRERSEIKVEGVDEKQLHHPFLLRMFANPAIWSLPMQLNFLVQRASLLLSLEESPNTQLVVMERCLAEDELFFNHYLTTGCIPSHLQAPYRALLTDFQLRTVRPHLIVHLRDRVSNLHARLETAHAAGTRALELSGEALWTYVEAMNNSYDSWAEKGPRLADTYVEYDISSGEILPSDLSSVVTELAAQL